MFGGGIQIACLIWNDVKTLVCAVVYHGSDQKRRNESRGTRALSTNHPILVTPGLSQTRPDTIGITINQANKDCLYKVQIPNPKYQEASARHQTTDTYKKMRNISTLRLRILLFHENKFLTNRKFWKDISNNYFSECLIDFLSHFNTRVLSFSPFSKRLKW